MSLPTITEHETSNSGADNVELCSATSQPPLTGEEGTPLSPEKASPPPADRSCFLLVPIVLWRMVVWGFRHWKISFALLFLGICAFLYWNFKSSSVEPLLAVSHAKSIAQTPEEIRVMRNIKQWEFLSVSTEELVEAHERGIISDKHLVRIYRGTLRLGIDMTRAKDDWFTASGKTAVLRLPDVSLLDADFIDDTETTSFHEKGTWTAQDKQKLFDKARQAMEHRAMSQENLQMARQNATHQFRKLFIAFGYDDVVITFDGQSTTEHEQTPH